MGIYITSGYYQCFLDFVSMRTFIILLALALLMNSCTQLTEADKLQTPEIGKSQIQGYLLLQHNSKKEPVKGTILYLAEVIVDSNGLESFVSMDRLHSPRTITNSDGFFVFNNVEPGRYGLVLDVITNSFLLNDSKLNQPLIITVLDNQKVDLGKLVYLDLPIFDKTKPYP